MKPIHAPWHRSAHTPVPKRHVSAAAIAAEVGVCAVAGAALGAIAGPAGAIAGALIGSFAGTIAAIAMDNASRDATIHDDKLDEEIGVVSGSLGAPGLKHPPARVGAYSAGSSGVPSSGGRSAEGPMQDVDSK